MHYIILLRFPDFILQAYADDLCLLIPAKLLGDVSKIAQPALGFIDSWITSVGLDVNVSKSQATIFRYQQGNLPFHPLLRLRGQSLAFVEEVKYLGVLISADLKFSEHIAAISKDARRMIGALRRKLGRHVSPNVLETVYFSCIRAKLDYGSMVWDPILQKDIDELEKTQFYALRLFLNNWTLSYDDALQLSGWKKLADRRKCLKLTQFYKFYHNQHEYPGSPFLRKVDSGRRINERLTEAHHLIVPTYKSDSYTQCFEHSCMGLWNKLSSGVALGSFPHFQNSINSLTFG